MKHTNNKGVSLIEILIAVVIFTICVTPIIYQLTLGMRISQRADDQQAATDYSKSIAETMKQMELQSTYTDAALTDLAAQLGIVGDIECTATFYSVKADGTNGTVIPRNSYLTSAPITAAPDGGSLGTPFNSVSAMYQVLKQANSAPGAIQEALVREYRFTGEAVIDYRDYDVDIVMNTLPYALSSLNNTSYTDPNAINVGNLSSLDSSATAIIPSVSNYDAVATASYFNAVISALESTGSEADANLATRIKNGTSQINDQATKEITVTVDGVTKADGTPAYEITCGITYNNPSIVGSSGYGVSAEDSVIEYVAYHQQFDKIPDIYLMYNQFKYHQQFADDKISIVNNTTDVAKLFVVRTAETNDNVRDITNEGSKDLVPTDTAQVRDQVEADGKYLYHTGFFLLQDPASHPVEIYTNIPLKQTVGGSEVSNITTSSDVDAAKYKMSINVSNPTSVVKEISEDERYSETGRVYNIVITLTNQKSGNETTIDTSKGDY